MYQNSQLALAQARVRIQARQARVQHRSRGAAAVRLAARRVERVRRAH